MSLIKKFIRFLLFGNYYLALCIVALSYETTLKSGFRISDLYYYILVFFAVVIYYTHAYINGSDVSNDANPRSHWYHQNRKLVYVTSPCALSTTDCKMHLDLKEYH